MEDIRHSKEYNDVKEKEQSLPIITPPYILNSIAATKFYMNLS